MSNDSDAKNVKLGEKALTTEFFVGLFALIGVACFGYLAIDLAGMKIFQRGFYSINAEFDNIAGLKLGAPVEIAGVKIGDVSKISLSDTIAVVTLQLREEISLRDDDIASIRTKGIIGDKYIKISPGGSEDLIETGGTIIDTESAVEFEEIIGKIIHRME